MKSQFTSYWSAGVCGVYIPTCEEGRIVRDIVSWASGLTRDGKPAEVWTWSFIDGLRRVGQEATANTKDPVGAAGYIRSQLYPIFSSGGGGVVIWRDLGGFPVGGTGANPGLVRAIKEMVIGGKSVGAMHIVVGVRFETAPELDRTFREIEYGLPDEAALREILRGAVESSKSGGFDPGVIDETRVLRGLRGLTASEAEDAVAVAIAETGGVNPETVFREKVAALRVSGGVEVKRPDPRGLESVGGLENLKAWLIRRGKAWDTSARESGVRLPKGVLLVGVPGTGKSHTARCIATAWGMLYCRLDMGKIYGSLVGQSEQNLRGALAAVEALTPCVLHIDEIEKAFAGFAGGGGDSGVSRRVGGRLLEWLNDQQGVFVVATANDIESVPPEFLRAGRFDAMFGLDLPHRGERAAILDLKLVERGKKNPGGDVVGRLDGYTGAEIEAVVDEAVLTAFVDGREEVSGEDLIEAMNRVRPQSKVLREKIDAIRSWIRERAMPASANEVAAFEGRRISK